MRYEHIVPGTFIERPNRFIARVEIDGRVETVHVKNTGRCKELLVPGVQVYLEQSMNPNRSTAYDLVAVEKNGRVVNMDSQATNKVVEEWLRGKALFSGVSDYISNITLVKPETFYGQSRFDFYVETPDEKIFIEVKGVTLEEDGVVRFPDAPSERAIKHMEELVEASRKGYRAMVIFVIQMEGVKYFTPNRDTHAAFGDALTVAQKAGVEVYAFDCKVTPDTLEINSSVPVSMWPVYEILRKGELEMIPNPLLKWYDSNKRVLPWRQDPTPYHVWVSEIMLQQTRVEAVKPYYKRFMNALPDIKSLAKAPEEKLLKLWEGLGYYNRVRNLQAAALQIMEQYDGEMPGDYEQLLKLKGIGSYTAGAISSIVFGRSHVAVDGNVLRVLSRYRMDEREISLQQVKSAVEQELQQVITLDRPGDFNQAMMELGACVCVPNGAPHCEQCPLREGCMAHLHGIELQYPKKAAAKGRSVEYKTILVLQDENRVALRKRPGKGLLAGMYEFPWLEGHCTPEQVLEYLTERSMKSIRITPLAEAKHIFTHKEWHMTGYLVRVDELERADCREQADDGPDTWLYVEPRETKDAYPIPAAFSAYAKYLNIPLGIAAEQEPKEK
ncbi:MAG: A/G-specific adenine glycosylase [Lachnospiraceae bacterium]|nr:A/G-specific adenine glycosylase [Lachnospiraceae bacterium]